MEAAAPSCSERPRRAAALLGLALLGGCSPDAADSRDRSVLESGRGGAGVGGTPAAGSPGSGSGGAVLGMGGATPRFDYGDAGPDETPADAGCEAIRDTRPVAPNVLVVVDRSGSMAFEGVDRWTPAVDAIASVTTALDDQIRFGLTVFPSLEGGCSTGEHRVAPDLGTSADIAADLATDSAPVRGGGTPTAATLGEAGALLGALPGTSYVLLLTDGGPNCNDAASADTCTCTRSPETYCRGGDVGGGALVNPTPILCLDDTSSVDAVGALAAAGVGTFVIGYDTGEWSATLDAMAAAGGTGRATHFPVSDGAGLEAALEAVSAFVVTCTYELSEEPPSDRYVSVSVDARALPHVSETDGRSGWQLVDGTVVELVGESCAAVSDGGGHEVVVVRECRPVLR